MGFAVDIPTPNNVPATVVRRDGDSEFSVNKVIGDLEGNAKTSDDGVTEVLGTGGLTLVLSNKVLSGSIDGSLVDGGKLIVLNNGITIGQESSLNLIAGTNVSLDVSHDPSNERVNVLIDATAGTTGATNLPGSSGSVAFYKQTSGGILEFRKLNAGSSRVTVDLDSGNDEVDVDIVPANIQHDELSGTGNLSHGAIDVILSDLSPSDAESLDGQSLTIESGTSTVSGYLSDSPTATYKLGDGAGSNVNYIIRDPTFTLSTPNPSSAINKGDEGELELFVNNVLIDSFNLDAAFDESERNGDQTYPPELSATGNIEIQSVGKYNNFRAYQKVVAHLIFDGSDLVEGYNSIRLEHGSQVSQTFDLFYDNDSGGNPDITTPTLTNLNLSSSKYLSGIRYASLGDTIDLGVVGNNLFNNVYHPSPIRYYNLTGVSNGDISVSDGDATGVSSPPKKGETMTVVGKTLAFTNGNVCSNDAQIVCRPRDPYGQYGTRTSSSQNLLVSTYGISSTTTAEYFRDENRRLPQSFDFNSTTAPLTGNWISSDALGSSDAQCYFTSTTTHGLVYPTTDFSSGYLPSNARDYSGRTGNHIYIRAFEPSTNQTSVTFTFNGVGSNEIGTVGNNNVNIEIKLPTQTGWLDCAKPYSSAAGVSSDGDGCLNGSISYSGSNATFTSTFGGRTTGDAGNRMYVRVTLRNPSGSVTSITTNW